MNFTTDLNKEQILEMFSNIIRKIPESKYEDYERGYWEDSWVWEYSDPENIGNLVDISSEILSKISI